MEYYHLSELRDCADGYKQLITYVDDFAKNISEHYRITEPISRAHEAMNNIDITEIHKVLEKINPNQSRVISSLENIIAVVNDLRDTIGRNMGRFIDVDSKASEFFRFLSSLIPILNNELKQLYERRGYEPTDDDEEKAKNVDIFVSGGYGKILVEDFIKDYLVCDISGNALIRRLNYLISICKYEPLVSSLRKYLLEAKKQNQQMLSVNVVNRATSTPKRSANIKSSSRKPKTFEELITLKDIKKKPDFLKTIHSLIDGEIGKHVALVILVCLKNGLLKSKPSYTIMINTFDNIGAKSGYDYQYSLGLKHYTEEEIKGIETHILPFCQ